MGRLCRRFMLSLVRKVKIPPSIYNDHMQPSLILKVVSVLDKRILFIQIRLPGCIGICIDLGGPLIIPACMDIWDDGMDEGGLGGATDACTRVFSILIWYLGRLARISSCLHSKNKPCNHRNSVRTSVVSSTAMGNVGFSSKVIDEEAHCTTVFSVYINTVQVAIWLCLLHAVCWRNDSGPLCDLQVLRHISNICMENRNYARLSTRPPT